MNDLLMACERLAHSRQGLRLAMAPAVTPGSAPGQAWQGASWWQRGVSRFAATSAGSVIVPAARLWWARQPMRPAVALAGGAARIALQPLAQAHPIKLLGAALLCGAVLSWARPWRWAANSAALTSLLPQLLLTAMTRAQPQR